MKTTIISENPQTPLKEKGLSIPKPKPREGQRGLTIPTPPPKTKPSKK
jgi:hypothetical protein